MNYIYIRCAHLWTIQNPLNVNLFLQIKVIVVLKLILLEMVNAILKTLMLNAYLTKGIVVIRLWLETINVMLLITLLNVDLMEETVVTGS